MQMRVSFLPSPVLGERMLPKRARAIIYKSRVLFCVSRESHGASWRSLRDPTSGDLATPVLKNMLRLFNLFNLRLPAEILCVLTEIGSRHCVGACLEENCVLTNLSNSS